MNKPELSSYMKWGVCVVCGEALVMFNNSPHEGLHTGPCYDEAIRIVKEYNNSRISKKEPKFPDLDSIKKICESGVEE